MASIPRAVLTFVGFPSPGTTLDPTSSDLPPAPVRRVLAELPGKPNSMTVLDYLQTVKKDHLSNDAYLDISKVAIYSSDFAVLPRNSPVGILRDGDMIIIAFHGGSMLLVSKLNQVIQEPKIQTNPIPIKINEKDTKALDKDKDDKGQIDLKDCSKSRDCRHEKKDSLYGRDDEENKLRTLSSRNDDKSPTLSPSQRNDQERRLNTSKNEQNSFSEEKILSQHRNDTERRISQNNHTTSGVSKQLHVREIEARYKDEDAFDQNSDDFLREASRQENKVRTRENIVKEDFNSHSTGIKRPPVPQTPAPHTPLTPKELGFHEISSNKISDRGKEENTKQMNRQSNSGFGKRESPKEENKSGKDLKPGPSDREHRERLETYREREDRDPYRDKERQGAYLGMTSSLNSERANRSSNVNPNLKDPGVRNSGRQREEYGRNRS
ncbi:hypothetical protein HK096_008841 [Nowakowskiella sp. JEL0078]|nr:hypothetical protein HK096_008841 [Nowakowskiella sp. JEL0078]